MLTNSTIELQLPVVNSTPLSALETTPHCASTNIWDILPNLCSINILITQRSLPHIIGNVPEPVESIECPTVIAVERTQQKSRLAACRLLALV